MILIGSSGAYERLNDCVLDAGNLAVPIVFIQSLLWLDDDHDLEALVQVEESDNLLVLLHEFDSFFEGCQLSHFSDFVICVAHDGDEHVEECDLNQESSNHPHDPDQSLVLSFEAIRLIVANAYFVLGDP